MTRAGDCQQTASGFDDGIESAADLLLRVEPEPRQVNHQQRRPSPEARPPTPVALQVTLTQNGQMLKQRAAQFIW